MQKKIITLDFKYRVGDLVEIRSPELTRVTGSAQHLDRLTLPGIILKANLRYVRFHEDFKWEVKFWRELAQRQMMSYDALVRSRIIEITEYNIIRLVNRATI